MVTIIKNFLKEIFSFIPDYSAYKELGFKASSSAYGFSLEKKSEVFVLSLFTSIEPHHPIFSKLIEVKHEDGCFVLFSENMSFLEKNIDYLKSRFDVVTLKENYCFFYLKFMRLEDPSLAQICAELIERLERH